MPVPTLPESCQAAPRERDPNYQGVHWIDTHKALVEKTATAVESDNCELLFCGDSITAQWIHGQGPESWNTHFAPRGALNIGIGGDETQHLLWRLQNNPYIKQLKPKHIILLIGTNNLGNAQHSPEDTARGIQTVINNLQQALPKAILHLLAIFPRSQQSDEPLRQAVCATNALLEKQDWPSGVIHHDIGNIFLEADARICEDVMYDYLHLTERGYQRYAEALIPFLNE